MPHSQKSFKNKMVLEYELRFQKFCGKIGATVASIKSCFSFSKILGKFDYQISGAFLVILESPSIKTQASFSNPFQKFVSLSEHRTQIRDSEVHLFGVI